VPHSKIVGGGRKGVARQGGITGHKPLIPGMNDDFGILDLIEGLQPHMRGRWAHVTTAGYMDALIEDHMRAAESAWSRP
jgi:hypothetical protein